MSVSGVLITLRFQIGVQITLCIRISSNYFPCYVNFREKVRGKHRETVSDIATHSLHYFCTGSVASLKKGRAQYFKAPCLIWPSKFSNVPQACLWGDTRHYSFPSGSVVKNPPAVQETQETRARSLGWEDPWRRAWQPTPVFLPGESHGQRSVAGYSP